MTTIELSAPRPRRDVERFAIHDGLLPLSRWSDPVVEALGHSPRSVYAETYWLPILGPSTLWMLRRLAVRLEAEPAGLTIDLFCLAGELGLGRGIARNSPVVKTIDRLRHFRMARVAAGHLMVRTAVPPLAQHNIRHLPDHLQRTVFDADRAVAS